MVLFFIDVKLKCYIIRFIYIEQYIYFIRNSCMARPPKKRYVKHRLSYRDFGPLDIEIDRSDDSKTVSITIDQLEAMRLADLEGMSHNDAADIMKVSRQTFGRIIEQARQSVTLALVNGKILNVESDDNIEFIEREVKCIECGCEWIQSAADDKIDDCGKQLEPVVCESCGSSEVIKRTRCGKFCDCPLRINKDQ